MRKKSKKINLLKNIKNIFGSTQFSDILIGSLLAVVVGIMPLVVRAAVRPLPEELSLMLHDKSPAYIDFLAYVRSWFLGLPAVIIAFYFISEIVTKGKVRATIHFKSLIKNPVIIASAVFIFFMLLSAILSDYTYTSFYGTWERHEGVFTWLAYFTVFIAAMYYVRKPEYAKPILWGLIFSSLIMGIIGIGQFAGYDFFTTDFANRLIAGRFYELTTETGIINEFDIAHGTLYNPNTFGKYTAMAAPILLISGFSYSGKKFVNALLLLAGTLMLIGVFASSSLGGMIGIIAAAAAAAVLLLISVPAVIKFSGWRTGLVIVPVLSVIVLSFLFIPFLNERAEVLYNRLQAFIDRENIRTEDYRVEGNTLHIIRNDKTLATITTEVEINLFSEAERSLRRSPADWVTVRDAAGEIVPLAHHQATPGLDEIFSYDYIFNIPEHGRIVLTRREGFFLYRDIVLMNLEGQLHTLCLLTHTPVDLSQPVAAVGFYKREAWGTHRGYIFSRTIAMMPQYWLVGSGPDTFINVFPHHDRFGLITSGMTTIADKSHNVYLQTWITKGGIAALALIFLFGHYLFTTFVSLLRAKKETAKAYGLRLGLLAGMTAFMVASLATDSTIGSTGVFFVLLGTGYGLNHYASTGGEDTAEAPAGGK
jgi:hypothetical protein